MKKNKEIGCLWRCKFSEVKEGYQQVSYKLDLPAFQEFAHYLYMISVWFLAIFSFYYKQQIK